MAPTIRELVIVLLQPISACLHLNENATAPDEVGKLHTALELGGGGEVIPREEGKLGGIGLFSDAILKGGTCLLRAFVAERLEQTVEESLSLALFIGLERLDEVEEGGDERIGFGRGHERRACE